MKIKALPLPYDTNIRNHFFLLMIVPLLIGLMISLTSFAHAEWNTKDDPLLNNSPTKQGWKQIQIYRSSSTAQKVEKKS